MKPAPLSLILYFARACLAALRCGRVVLLAMLPLFVQAQGETQPLPVLTLSVLQFGTPHWELDHLKRHNLDRANGFELKVRLVADLPASRLALSSGSVGVAAVTSVTFAVTRT